MAATVLPRALPPDLLRQRARSFAARALTVAALALLSCRGASAAPAATLEVIAEGFERPVFVTSPPDGTGRLFVVEQTGTIRVLPSSAAPGGRPWTAKSAEVFLDVTGLLHSSQGEMGLLGLAFHPQFKTNGQLFIAYTAKGLKDAVARYRVDTQTGKVIASSAETILLLDDPAGNHNGGMLAFGPDGHLYVGTGDGGGGNDQFGNGRDMSSLLAKMLRIDVGGVDEARKKPYRVPPDNPFVGKPGYAPEIWQVGLRNPWRYSFDRATGDLWIADVGQNRFEMVHFAPAGKGGQDFGWSIVEASHCFRPKTGCDKSGLTLPVHEYPHPTGCSVTGGYVYRGKQVPALVGRYLFSDYCTGKLWSLKRAPDGTVIHETLLDTKKQISSFGEDAAGEIYLVDHQGSILRLRGAGPR